MDALRQDLRYALRVLRKKPGFTAVVILTLGLGIGANTAIFGLLDQVLLRPMPVDEPERLVLLRGPGPNTGSTESFSNIATPFSHPMYEDFRDRNAAFSGVLARFPVFVNVALGDETERVVADLVSGTYFEVLGLRPAAGRLLTPEDDRIPGGHPLVVLSHSYWVRRFAGDREIVGQKLSLNRQPMTVVGVTPAGFHGIELGRPVDVMVPLMMKAQITPTWNGLGERRSMWLQVLARLRPGTSVEQATAAMNVLYRQILEEEAQQLAGRPAEFLKRFVAKRLELVPGWQGIPDLEQRLSTPLLVLMAMVGLLLLIACANVANLLLAHASSRQREVAVRLALGAARGRLVRQLLVESVLLALLGGVAGLFFASWTGKALLRLLPFEGAAQTLSTQADLRVAGFTFGLSLLTGIVFGLAPALQSTRPELAPALKEGAGSLAGVLGSLRLRKGLVVAQVALSLLLLVAAGLFTGSLHNLRGLDPGFQRNDLLTFAINPGLNGYDRSQKLALYAQLQETIGALPGVRSVSMAQEPLLADSTWSSTIRVEGYEHGEDENMNPSLNAVGPGFFPTLGMPLLMGRDFDERDTADAPRVAVVNQTFARYFFGDQNPIGRRFGRGRRAEAHDLEIVGLVQDGKYDKLREQVPRFAYVPYTQGLDTAGITYYVRSSGEATALAERVRDALRRLDPHLPLLDVRTMRAQIDESLYVDRMVAGLSTAFGLLATLLAALGLYGLMSYAVSCRTREIGIRVALGAERSRILSLVLGEVARLTALGIGIGLPGGWGVGRVVESQLFGLDAADPLILGLATTALVVAALGAGLVPAVRATRVHPAVVLRDE